MLILNTIWSNMEYYLSFSNNHSYSRQNIGALSYDVGSVINAPGLLLQSLV